MFLSEHQKNLKVHLFFKSPPRIPKFILICPSLREGQTHLHQKKEGKGKFRVERRENSELSLNFVTLF